LSTIKPLTATQATPLTNIKLPKQRQTPTGILLIFFLVFVCCSIVCHYVLSSCCDVRYYFRIKTKFGSCLIYDIWKCWRIVVSKIYCVVHLCFFFHILISEYSLENQGRV